MSDYDPLIQQLFDHCSKSLSYIIPFIHKHHQFRDFNVTEGKRRLEFRRDTFSAINERLDDLLHEEEPELWETIILI